MASNLPLQGIRVLELAGLAPGPFCGMILADFGASVIRVDKSVNPLPNVDVLSHGKRSIALNLKNKAGIDIYKKLSDKSDVIIDPFRKGVAEKLQIGPNDLMKTNKRLIYARLSGFGHSGPYASMAGHDINYVAISGLLSLFGRFGEKLTPPCNLISDFGGGGLMCALGILLALIERSKSNVGQVVDASMVDGTAYLGSWLYRSQQLPALWGNPRGKNILDTGSHFYNVYETEDKQYMSVGALEPNFYKVFLDKLGLSEEELPHYSNFEENCEKLDKIFKQKTQAEWCAIFDGTDACVTPVLDIGSTPNHKYHQERKTFEVLEDNTIVPKPAPHLSRTPGISAGTQRNPEIGEHTVDILTELNFNETDIKNLVSKGVVAVAGQHSKI